MTIAERIRESEEREARLVDRMVSVWLGDEEFIVVDPYQAQAKQDFPEGK